jgi:hypothetical protein
MLCRETPNNSLKRCNLSQENDWKSSNLAKREATKNKLIA